MKLNNTIKQCDSLKVWLCLLVVKEKQIFSVLVCWWQKYAFIVKIALFKQIAQHI
jgi:hypothetical protein